MRSFEPPAAVQQQQQQPQAGVQPVTARKPSAPPPTAQTPAGVQHQHTAQPRAKVSPSAAHYKLPPRLRARRGKGATRGYTWLKDAKDGKQYGLIIHNQVCCHS